MTEQLQFPLRAPASPAVDESDLATLIAQLSIAPGWIKARHLTPLTGFDDRKLRAIASASQGRIISGCQGYRLTRNATIAEINHCTAQLRSQASAMTHRALQIDRVYHSKLQ